jgi:hypothetical protein
LIYISLGLELLGKREVKKSPWKVDKNTKNGTSDQEESRDDAGHLVDVTDDVPSTSASNVIRCENRSDANVLLFMS